MDEKLLRKVTREFNRYRAPEGKARVLVNKDDTLVVEFTGTKAPFACCFDEFFVDYRYYLHDIAKRDFEIKKIERPAKARFVVTYKISLQKRLCPKSKLSPWLKQSS